MGFILLGRGHVCVGRQPISNEELTIKIRVQSRGKMILKALGIAAVVSLAGLISLSNDPEFKVDVKKGQMEGKSKGFLKSYSEFLDKKQERKKQWLIFLDSMESSESKKNKGVRN